MASLHHLIRWFCAPPPQKFSPSLIQYRHHIPCRLPPLFRVRFCQPYRKALLVYLKGKATALIVIGQSAQVGIFRCKRRQSIFKVGIISTDFYKTVCLVKPYFRRFIFLFNSRNHIGKTPPFFWNFRKHPVFCSKSTVQDHTNLQFFKQNFRKQTIIRLRLPEKKNIKKLRPWP